MGLSKPNAFGLYDMHGNVSELVLDAWQDWPNPPPGRLEDPFRPPKSADAWITVRGGACWRRSDKCSSRWRAGCEPMGAAYRGFRIVLGPVYGAQAKRRR